MTDEDKTWVRSLPLLLVAGVLLVAGALSFFNKGDVVLSVAAATTGVFLLGAWSATAIADWSKNHRRKETTDA